MSTINRITGLATGIDTESMVQQLMDAENTRVEKLEKEQTLIEWQREALLDVNSKLLNFRSESLNMKLESTYKSYSATSSNSNIVSAETTADAKEGTYKVTVKQVATQTTLTGELPEPAIRSSATISKNTNFSGKEFEVTYNGETKTIKFGAGEAASSNTAASFQSLLQSKIDDAFGTGQIQVAATAVGRSGFTVAISSATSLNLPVTLTAGDSSNDALSLMNISDGATTTFNTSRTLEELMGSSAFSGSDDITINVNGKNFTFNKGDSVSSVFSELNKDTDIDINIRYSNAQEQVIIKRDSYGEGRSLSLGGSEEFWNSIGIELTSEFMTDHITDGQNAIFNMSAPDGESAENIEVASNSFSYGGISMTFLEADQNQTVNITVSKNVDEIYGKIESFVKSYNELLTTLNKYYKEEKSGYEPLTDSERESLSEEQEKQWEEKAKQGILRRDSTLQSAISSMREAVTSYVNNSSISSLFQIGISTSSYDAVNSENNGKLVIDEDTLKQAIKDDIDGVATLFAGTASVIQGSKVEASNYSSLNGKSFSITYAGKTETITFDKNFDVTTTSGATEFEDYLKGIFNAKFGEGEISVTYSSGKLLINSTKSKALQLNSNSDSSNDALSLMGIRDGAKYDSSENGFAVRIYNICTTAMNSIIDKAGSVSNIVDTSTLGQSLKRKKEQISTMQDRLDALEDKYYNQFAAMEEAISKMNSQSESLANLLNGN